MNSGWIPAVTPPERARREAAVQAAGNSGLELAPRPVYPPENRRVANAPLQEAVAPQELATGGDVNLTGANMQPRSALGGAAGVEPPSEDAPGNSIGESEPETSIINPASEFARGRKDALKRLGRQFAEQQLTEQQS